MDDRKILNLTYFGKQPENIDYQPFKHNVGQCVTIDVETGILTGVILDRYSTNNGENYYNIALDKIWQGYESFPFSEHRLRSNNDETTCGGLNIIPEYTLSSEKRFAHNYKLSSEETDLKLDKDTFCPFRSLNLKLSISMDGQHDGHLWSKQWVQACSERLIQEIMADLKLKIEQFVEKVDPFNIHKDFEGMVCNAKFDYLDTAAALKTLYRCYTFMTSSEMYKNNYRSVIVQKGEHRHSITRRDYTQYPLDPVKDIAISLWPNAKLSKFSYDKYDLTFIFE